MNPTARLLAEGLVSLSSIARKLPSSRASKLGHLHPSAVFRWVSEGAKSPSGEIIKLEACLLMGRYATSLAAVERFITATSPQSSQPTPAPSSESKPRPKANRRTAAARKRAAEKASRDLERQHA